MEAIKLQELKKIVKFCRENGVNSLKTGDFELTLSPAALFPKDRIDTDNKETVIDGGYTEEQALYWSSQGAAIPEFNKDS